MHASSWSWLCSTCASLRNAGCQPAHPRRGLSLLRRQQEAVRPFTAAATPVMAVPTQAMAETQGSRSAPAGQKAGAEDTPPWGRAQVKEAARCAASSAGTEAHAEPEQLAEQDLGRSAAPCPGTGALSGLHLRLKKLHLFQAPQKPARAGAPGELALPSGRR